jgi:hypothetical protein
MRVAQWKISWILCRAARCREECELGPDALLLMASVAYR